MFKKYLVSTSGEYDEFRGDPRKFRLGAKRSPGRVKMMLGVHVDDVTVAILNAECDVLVRSPGKSLSTNNVGELTYYTDCVFERDSGRGALNISQSPCTDRLVDRFGIT